MPIQPGIGGDPSAGRSQRAVFLSYASEDAEAAHLICATLRDAGIEVWFDQSELKGGDAWDRQIRQQIHDCALFVPIISARSQSRLEGYFRREWKLAADRTHDMAEERAFLVPVVIDDTSERSASVPDKFREIQWSRLPAGAASPTFVERVRRLLSHETHTSVVPSAKTPTTAFKVTATRDRPPLGLWPSWRSTRVLGLVTAVAIVVGYVAVDRFGVFKGSAPGARKTAWPSSSGVAARSTIYERSIAVLPFVDMSEKKDQEYFAAGMAEEVTDLLAKLPDLRVVGRTSSFQFNDKNEDLRAIGAQLGAAYLVEGSVRRFGGHVRVTAQLIDARDGLHRWSDTYDRDIRDVLSVQDDIAASLARALQITVSDEFGSRPSVKSPEAYSQYLRGLHALDKRSKEGCEEAVAEFQRALDLEPTFARAAVGLANAYRFIGENAWQPAAFEHARQSAEMALQLDPKLGAAHAVLAEVHVIHDWDWSGAEQEIEQARKLGAGVQGTVSAARLAAALGEWDQAGRLFRAGLAVDPLNPELHSDLAYLVYLRSERFPEAELSLRRALEISPNIGTNHYFLGLTLLFQGRLNEALAAMQRETLDDGQLEGSAIVYHAMVWRDDLDEVARRSGWRSANAAGGSCRR